MYENDGSTCSDQIRAKLKFLSYMQNNMWDRKLATQKHGVYSETCRGQHYAMGTFLSTRWFQLVEEKKEKPEKSFNSKLFCNTLSIFDIGLSQVLKIKYI